MKGKMKSSHIAIFDYGSQYTRLIARRVREMRVYSEVVPFTTRAADLRGNMPDGIILSGGPDSVFAEGAPAIDPAIFELGVPVLGICYGMQLAARTLGGEVVAGEKREYGKAELKIERPNALFEGVPEVSAVWMSHGDRVSRLPEGFTAVASSANCPYAAVCDEKRRLYALQFHPEVVHTRFGGKIIGNFVFGVCDCKPDWDMGAWIDGTVASLKEKIGDGHVVLGLSGGVDSSVAAVLIHRAIGPRLHCIFVDNGLLRKGEADEVEATFKGKYDLDLAVARAAERFYRALAGIE